MTVTETPANRRRIVKYFAGAMALLTSFLYFLIGLQAVTVLENADDQTAFGFIAGGAFLAGALVILFFDNQVLMGLGATAQVFIIFMYFNLAPEREPSYEVWGILIRVLQVLLLVALTYLAIRPKVVRPPKELAAEQVKVG